MPVSFCQHQCSLATISVVFYGHASTSDALFQQQGVIINNVLLPFLCLEIQAADRPAA